MIKEIVYKCINMYIYIKVKTQEAAFGVAQVYLIIYIMRIQT